jgi:peptidyl-prolyl cis-trans isomerase SurA
MGRLFLAAACLVVAMAPSSRALDQPAALVVNGQAITYDDIEQRTKFIALANGKSPARREIIEELINDKLKVQEARRYKIDLTDKDIDAQYADMAKRMHVTSDELTQLLGQNGIDAKPLRAKILAELSWQYVIRGLFGSGPEASAQNANGGTANQKKGDPNDEYNYTLRPILFQAPPGDTALLEAHKKDAEALRARFTDCDSGLSAARTQHDVVIREPITKNSSELPYALRELLAGTELGHLTPPDTTSYGIQLFAVCARKESMVSQKSKAYLRELRRRADIRSIRDDVRGDISNDRLHSVPVEEPARR